MSEQLYKYMVWHANSEIVTVSSIRYGTYIKILSEGSMFGILKKSHGNANCIQVEKLLDKFKNVKATLLKYEKYCTTGTWRTDTWTKKYQK